MSAVSIIIDIILILVSIILIITVLMQQGQREGLGAIGGGAETFFGKNKAKSYEGKLAKLTKICAIGFSGLAIVATIVTGNKDRRSKTTTDTTAAVTAEPTVEADATEEAVEPTAEATDAADTEAEPTAEAEETVEPEDTTEG